MIQKLEPILNLPPDDQIECIFEEFDRLNPLLVIKKVRYRKGLVLVFTQDVEGNIFQVVVGSCGHPLWQTGNRIWKPLHD